MRCHACFPDFGLPDECLIAGVVRGYDLDPGYQAGMPRASRLQPSRADPPCSITTRSRGRSPRSCRSGSVPASSRLLAATGWYTRD